jgi:hypothetical protein
MKIFGFSVSVIGFFFIFAGIFDWFREGYDMQITVALIGGAIAITGFAISAIAFRNR